jgi:hypothetical protein
LSRVRSEGGYGLMSVEKKVEDTKENTRVEFTNRRKVKRFRERRIFVVESVGILDFRRFPNLILSTRKGD